MQQQPRQPPMPPRNSNTGLKGGGIVGLGCGGILVIVTVLAILGAIGQATGLIKPEPTHTTAAAASPSSSSSTKTTAPAPKPVSTVRAAKPRISRAAGPPKVTGYGALVTDWLAAHTEGDISSGGNAGADNQLTGALSDFNPDPTLPKYDEFSTTDTYVHVTALQGRVTNYVVNLHLGTTLEQGLAIARQELPPDARRQWTSAQNRCVQARYVSRTLSTVLGAADPEGAVFVELTDEPPGATDLVPSPKTFTNVSLSLGTPDAQGVTPGFCV